MQVSGAVVVVVGEVRVAWLLFESSLAFGYDGIDGFGSFGSSDS